jgi:hypothetical protein
VPNFLLIISVCGLVVCIVYMAMRIVRPPAVWGAPITPLNSAKRRSRNRDVVYQFLENIVWLSPTFVPIFIIFSKPGKFDPYVFVISFGLIILLTVSVFIQVMYPSRISDVGIDLAKIAARGKIGSTSLVIDAALRLIYAFCLLYNA